MPKTHHTKCTPEQDAAVREAAARSGYETLSEFIRAALAEKCQQAGVHYPDNLPVWTAHSTRRLEADEH